MPQTRAGKRRIEEGGSGEGVAKIKKRNPMEEGNRDSEAPPFFFPFCVKPAAKCFVRALLPPLDKNDTSVISPEATYAQIHARLHRLMAVVPYIALFPFLITDITPPSRRTALDRGQRIKTEHDIYDFTASYMMKWEKGDRPIRMGMFLSKQPKESTSHIWAAAVVDSPFVEGGKFVVIYEPDAADIFKSRSKNLLLSDMNPEQQNFVKLISTSNKLGGKRGKSKIIKVLFGGTVDFETTLEEKQAGEGFCLENTFRWMEKCESLDFLKLNNLLKNNFVFIRSNPSPTQRRTRKELVAIQENQLKEKEESGDHQQHEQEQTENEEQTFQQDSEDWQDYPDAPADDFEDENSEP